MADDWPALTRWQADLLRMIAGLPAGYKLSLYTGHRAGRVYVNRVAIEIAVRRGEHVHYCAHDGVWCVTAQPAGLLWAKITPPVHPATHPPGR